MTSRRVAFVLLVLLSCQDDSSDGCATGPEDSGVECTQDDECLYCCVDGGCDACNYPEDFYECAADSECGSKVCHQGTCMECADDSDCEDEMGGVQCVQVVAGEPELHCGCTSDLDCADLERGTKCIEGGVCGCRMNFDEDCPDKKWCVRRECFPL